MLKEFKEFIARGNVMDLAVGVIIGAAFTAIVNSIVADLFNPLIGLAMGGVDLSNIFVTLKAGTRPGPYATLAAAKEAGAVTLNVGVFLNAVVQFLLVAFVLFLLVRGVNRLRREEAEKPEAQKALPAPTREEALLTEIRDLLARR
jgi:large conductance mechanosensitive channel